MGYFVLYSDGNMRPSDSYLATHHLEEYSLDPDTMYDPDYDLDEDREIMTMPRICDHCGRTFTFEEAESDFYTCLSWTMTDFPDYRSEYAGELCGSCAAEDYTNK